MLVAAFLALFALYLAGLAAYLGGWYWLLLWPALSFAVVAAGYARIGPRVFGKRANGRLGVASCVALLPFLALSWGVWHLSRLLSRSPCCHEIVPGLWLGRRPLAGEIPAGVDLVVDLTAEFFPARGVASGRTYLTLPTLDADSPDEERLRSLIVRVATHPGVVYVHCAQGRGRSALLVAAVLLERGLASDGGEAIRMLSAARPGIHLTRRQRALFRRLHEKRGA